MIFISHSHQTIANLHQNSASEQLQQAPGPEQNSFAEEPVPDLPQTALIPATFGVLQFWPGNKQYQYIQILQHHKAIIYFQK